LTDWFHEDFLFTSKCAPPEKLSFGSFACNFKTISAKKLPFDWLIPTVLPVHIQVLSLRKSFIWLLPLYFQNQKCKVVTTWLIDSYRASCSHPSVFSQKNFHLAPLLAFSKPKVQMELPFDWLIPTGLPVHIHVCSLRKTFIWLFCLNFQNHKCQRITNLLNHFHRASCLHSNVFSQKYLHLASLLAFSKPLWLIDSCRPSCLHYLFTPRKIAFNSFTRQRGKKLHKLDNKNVFDIKLNS